MSYIALSDKDKKEMLERIGVASVDELYGCLPDDVKLRRRLRLPEAKSEPELERSFDALAARNTYPRFLSFLGAGVYRHFIPATVDYLSARSEFVTPYTPYQPEVSQGTLQIIFEYQTLVCQLTGMDISNASLYDGAMAAAEGVLMAHRLNGRNKVLVARSLHPQYRETIKTYTRNLGLVIEEVGFGDCGGLKSAELEAKLGPDVCGIIVQSPNFFGVVEDVAKVVDIAHRHQALAIVAVAEAVSLGILESPGHFGADIVCGEAQSFGMAPGFGGPFLGFMACKKEHVRQLPGRLSGQTKDVDGRRGFVLTLSTREQHIRREKATSNICTNQAWCALRATIFLETLGHDGLREMAVQNMQKAAYAAETLAKVKGVRLKFSGRFFNEFVLELPKNAQAVLDALKAKGILGGLALERYYPELRQDVLLNVTEAYSKDDIDKLAVALGEVLR
jgi:glycine dehydrogenase subunit 1